MYISVVQHWFYTLCVVKWDDIDVVVNDKSIGPAGSTNFNDDRVQNAVKCLFLNILSRKNRIVGFIAKICLFDISHALL